MPRCLIVDQRGAGLVGFAGLDFDAGGKVVVLVPALMVKLDEPYAALGQPPGEETIGGIRARLAAVRAVKFKHARRFL